jgi:glycosyltransferase involved in cell wall biosynthesis
MSDPIIDVVHLTPRRNFDVAKVLKKRKMLGVLVTDIYLKSRCLEAVNKYFSFPFRRIRIDQYNAPSLDSNVKSRFRVGLLFRLMLKILPRSRHYWAQLFGQKAVQNILSEELSRRPKSDRPRFVYALDTGALEIFESGFYSFKILEQCVAPRNKLKEVYAKLSQLSPSLVGLDTHCDILHKRERREWELANLIITPSEYVKKEIVANGISADKIVVVPYSHAYENDNLPPKPCGLTNSPLKVLFVGNDAYRKGLQDILEAAKILKFEPFDFIIAGNVQNELLHLLNGEEIPNLRIEGKVGASRINELYREADVFLLPSYLEGSAVVTYEAMSFGLCVITTPESGSVVENGVSGVIINAGDCQAIVAKLRVLAENNDLRFRLGSAAKAAARLYRALNYEERLISAIMQSLDEHKIALS